MRHPPQTVSDTLTGTSARAILLDADAKSAWADSQDALQEAPGSADDTNGAVHFLLDYPGLKPPSWAADDRETAYYGPFVNTAGGGIRGFHFSKEGLVVLEGDPDGGFPPTDPDMLTIYVDDDDICRWKHTWKKYHFEIVDSPTTERINEAGTRQRQRVGYSYREMPTKEQRRFPPE